MTVKNLFLSSLVIGVFSCQTEQQHSLSSEDTKEENKVKICADASMGSRYILSKTDFKRPNSPTFWLYYEVSSQIDSSRPFLFYIHDGQQPVGVRGYADELKKRYGVGANIVVMGHRGNTCSPINVTTASGTTDWIKAQKVFASYNVVEDIEQIRLSLIKTGALDSKHKINIFGQSGGGILAAQYLAKYHPNVARAMLQVTTDNVESSAKHAAQEFLTRITRQELYKSYKNVLADGKVDPNQFTWVLQKLGYGHFPDEKVEENLIKEVSKGDLSNYMKYSERFGDVYKMQKIYKEKIPFSLVRIFEVITRNEKALPTPNTAFHVLTQPLYKLRAEGKLQQNLVDVSNLMPQVSSRVLLVAAKWDHIMPAKEMIQMQSRIPRSQIVVLNDLHRFTHNRKCATGLFNEFLGGRKFELTKLLRNFRCRVAE